MKKKTRKKNKKTKQGTAKKKKRANVRRKETCQ